MPIEAVKVEARRRDLPAMGRAERPRRLTRAARAATLAEKAAPPTAIASGGEGVVPGRLYVVAALETTALSRIAPPTVKWKSAPAAAGLLPTPLSRTTKLGAVGAAAPARGGLKEPTGQAAPVEIRHPSSSAPMVTSKLIGYLVTPGAVVARQGVTPIGAVRGRKALSAAPRKSVGAVNLDLASCGASMTAYRRLFASLTACGRIVSTNQPLPSRWSTAAPRGTLGAAYGLPAAKCIVSTFIVIVDKGYFADKLVEAFVPNVREIVDMTLGGVAPGVALTPQKRGLPPPRTGRGRRLPIWTAALGRPTLFLVLPISLYKKIIDAPWTVLRT